MDLHLQRHRPGSDRAASPHRRDRQNHLRLYGRDADQHHRRAFACHERSRPRRRRPAEEGHGPEQRSDDACLQTSANWPTSSVIATIAGNLTTSFTYDSAGNLTKTTLPDSSYLAYGYDNAHRVTSITNSSGESQGITYDSAGNVTQTLWKNASSVTKRQHTATYDALGRTLTDVGGMSQSTAFTYDKNGNVLTITDPLSPRHHADLRPVKPALDPQGRGAESFQHQIRQPQPPARPSPTRAATRPATSMTALATPSSRTARTR